MEPRWKVVVLWTCLAASLVMNLALILGFAFPNTTKAGPDANVTCTFHLGSWYCCEDAPRTTISNLSSGEAVHVFACQRYKYRDTPREAFLS